MSESEKIRIVSEIEWMIVEPHVTRWMEAQQRLQAVVTAIAPEPGARLDLDTKTWSRAPEPLAELIDPSASVEA